MLDGQHFQTFCGSLASRTANGTSVSLVPPDGRTNRKASCLIASLPAQARSDSAVDSSGEKISPGCRNQRGAFDYSEQLSSGAAEGLAGRAQQEIFEDQLSVAADERCVARAARDLAIIGLRPRLAFDDLIKRTAAGALELECPEHGCVHHDTDCFQVVLRGRRADAAVDFGLPCQISDGNVNAKLSRPSASITANANMMVI